MRMSARGLVRFMTSSPSGQRKVLRDYKYPEPEGVAQASYYRDVMDVIERYHREERDKEWVLGRALALEQTSWSASGSRRTRLVKNLAAIRAYANQLPRRHYVLLGSPRLAIEAHDVYVSVAAPMHVRENGREKLVLVLPGERMTEHEARLYCQITCEAADRAGLDIAPRDVVAVMLHAGATVTATPNRARVRRDIDAALQNIAAMWPSIEAA